MPIFSRFGADFFMVYADFSRFIRDINGEKKHLVIDMSFFTVSFSRFAPSREKTAFFYDLPLCPQGPRPTPLKSANFIFIVVSPSLKEESFRVTFNLLPRKARITLQG